MVVGWKDLRRRRKKDENGKYFITLKYCIQTPHLTNITLQRTLTIRITTRNLAVKY